MELNIEKFDPTVEELTKMVVASKKIVVTDINDKAQIEAVRTTRIELKGVRVTITKRGKEMREEANAFQKAVIAKEKELVAIIEPEELRLEAIEEEVKAKKTREERVALLPIRRTQLDSIGDNEPEDDDFLLGMNTEQFQEYYNRRVASKNEVDKLAMEAERNAIQAEKDRLENEKVAREREAIARREEQEEAGRKLALAKEEAEMRVQREKEDADRRVKEEGERVKREQKEKEEREAQEKLMAENKAQEEKEKLEKRAKYQKWMKENNFDEKTDILKDSETEIIMYRKVSSFKK